MIVLSNLKKKTKNSNLRILLYRVRHPRVRLLIKELNPTDWCHSDIILGSQCASLHGKETDYSAFLPRVSPSVLREKYKNQPKSRESHLRLEEILHFQACFRKE